MFRTVDREMYVQQPEFQDTEGTLVNRKWFLSINSYCIWMRFPNSRWMWSQKEIQTPTNDSLGLGDEIQLQISLQPTNDQMETND